MRGATRRGRPRGRNHFVKSRAEREKRLVKEFEHVINGVLKRIGSNLRFRYRGKSRGPDYVVYDVETGQVVCYFEAEFPDPSRWPPGGEWQYPTIRWPSRKWDDYMKNNGLFENRAVFLISVREDLADAYYIDCRTWFKKAVKERLTNGTIYYGLSKEDPELGRGIDSITAYIRNKIEENYAV